MHPVLITFSIFGKEFSLHFYGVMIALGATSGYLYLVYHGKKTLGVSPETIQGLAILIIFASVIGGKLFFFLEAPKYYFGTPANMLKNFRTGFVFYGSLLFAVPMAIWYVRNFKLPVLPLLDRLAIAACIIHAFGRVGCFMAGCCYGTPTTRIMGVKYNDALSQAPLHQSLHPTQLYEVILILGILLVLGMFRRYKRFEGQLFMLYIILYGVGRSITEVFRGDIRRGFIIEGILSHSQLISLVMIALVLLIYVRLYKKANASAANPHK